ncbi:MAG: helix-turn-helix domain-containing protein [Dysgonamonadaceae bacterium]|nr:helix-turn-helix domain-containing protein [Dysgonamonadaceae bacterium]
MKYNSTLKVRKKTQKVRKKILNAIIENPQITIKELSELTQTTTRTIEKTIFKLKSLRFIERIGHEKVEEKLTDNQLKILDKISEYPYIATM